MKELLQNGSLARRGATALALILAGTLSAGQAAAQTGTVTGVVTDEVTGQPLESALVRMAGQEGGVLTNQNGRYVMPGVPVGSHSVTFVIVGYEESTLEVSVGAGQTAVLDAPLSGEAIRIQELVVTGVARATPRVKLPFTVEKVDVAASPVPAISAESFLVGKVPGVKVVRGSGQPGSSGDILLRGATSISGGQAPLIVVDGVVTTNSFDDLATLDVESMEIVKGAAGAALYGSRAANGVIQVRTKRGGGFGADYSRIIGRSEVGQARLAGTIQLSKYHPWLTDANGDLAYIDADSNLVSIPNFTDPDAQLPHFEGAGNNPFTSFQDNPWPSRYPLYDHVKRVFQPGTYLTNHVATSGQSGNTNYRASFDMNSELGVLPDYNDGFGRKGFRLNIDHGVRDNLTVSLSTAYTQSEQEDLGGSPFYNLTFMGPYVDLLKRDPTSIGARHCPPQGCLILNPDPLSAEENPLYHFELVDYRDFQHDVKAAITTRWSPASWFDIEGLFGLDRNSFSEHNFTPAGRETFDGGITTGSYGRFQSHRRDINAEVTASAQQAWNGFTNRFRARYTREDRQFENFSASGSDFVATGVPRLNNFNQEGTSASSFLRSIIGESYFVIADVDYNGKYIVGGLVRRDGSSLFGADERWHTYYRASLAYRMAQEDWWPLDAVDEFKLSWSQGTAGRRPGFSAQYETYSVSSTAITPISLGNKALKPQQSIENEYNLDVVLFNKISTGFTYAQTTSTDQLLAVPLPSVSGFSSQWQNAGTLESQGWEFFVEAPLVEREDLSWTMRLNLDRFSEKITELGRPAYRSGFFYYRDDEIFGAFYGAKWAQSCADLPSDATCSQFEVNDDGLMVWVGDGNTYTDGMGKNLWGTSSEDGYRWGMPVRMFGECETRKQDGEGCKDFLFLGNTRPDLNVSWRNTFRWRGLQAYVLMDAELGTDIYNRTRQWAYRENRSGDMDQFGKPDETKKPSAYYQTLYNTNAMNAWFVEDGTFVKLREASIRYSVNPEWLDSWFNGRVTGMDVNLIGRNLLTFTNYKGYDPEVANGNGGSDAIGRIDSYGYPNSRVFSASIQVIF